MCFPSAAVFYSIESVNVHVTLFQDFKGCAGYFLGATAASPLNTDPFLGALAHIFVEAQLESDLTDPGSVFFEADFLPFRQELGGCLSVRRLHSPLFSNPRRLFYNRKTSKSDFFFKLRG